MSLPELARSKSHQNRTYVHPVTSEEFPSVTTITGMKDKPALVNWAANATIDYALAKWDELSPLTKKLRRILMKDARYEIKVSRTSFSASNVGNLTHDMVEQYLATGVPAFSPYGLKIISEAEISPAEAMDQVLPWFASFKAWEDRFKPTDYLSEVSVFNRTVGYAGTLDMMFRIGTKWYLTDMKCGRQAYPDTSFQLTALAHGEEIVSLDGTIRPMPPIESLSILHLTPKYCDWIEIKQDPATWEAFKSLAVVQRWEVERKHLQFGTTVRTVNNVQQEESSGSID